MKYTVTWTIILIAASVISVSGCGKWANTTGNITAYEKTMPIKVDNPQVKEFNKQLGEIKDEPSAEKAVNSFVNYVDSRLDRSTCGASIQSLSSLIRPEVVKDIAKREAQARNAGGISMMSDTANAEPLLDVGTITDNINSLGSGEGIRVDDETVTTAKTVVEGSIPNINPDNRPGITPLEAAVVGYALVSGDDGTASQESVKLPADKINSFVENITN